MRGFDGLEAIGFAPPRSFFTVEAEDDTSMAGYFVGGVADTEKDENVAIDLSAGTDPAGDGITANTATPPSCGTDLGVGNGGLDTPIIDDASATTVTGRACAGATVAWCAPGAPSPAGRGAAAWWSRGRRRIRRIRRT